MPRYCLTLDLQDDPAKIAEYERLHRKIWPEIRASILDADVTGMEIYQLGTHLFMIMDVGDNFSFDRKAAMDAANPKVLEWENLVSRYQAVAPGSDPVRHWERMELIFDLAKQ